MPYTINAFTGELDATKQGGVTPIEGITINAETGPAILGVNFTFKPKNPYDTVKVLESLNIAGDSSTRFVNNAWETPYIVDPSNVVGLKGTFQTVQDAVTAAFANGDASTTRFATIIIRNVAAGSISENIVFPVAKFHIKGLIEGSVRVSQPTYITGKQTIPAGAQVIFENIGLNALSGSVLDHSGSAIFLNSWTTQIDQTRINTSLFFYNSSIGSFNVSNGTFEAYSTEISRDGNSVLSTTSLFTLRDCVGSGSVYKLSLNGASSGIIDDCNRMIIDGNTAGNISIDSTSISESIDLPNANVLYSSIFCESDKQVLSIFSSNTFKIQLRGASKGNLVFRKIVSANSYTILATDQFLEFGSGNVVAVDIAASPLIKNQEFYIVDSSGNRRVNALTITAGVGRTINGSPTLVMRQNYGFVRLVWDGSNNFNAQYDRWLEGDNSGLPPIAGNLGQYIVSRVNPASALTLANGVALNIASITLPKGIYSLNAVIGFNGGMAGVPVTFIEGSISSTSGTRGSLGDASTSSTTGAGPNNTDTVMSITDYDLTLSATTTIYLVAFGLFPSGTLKAYGRISARRVG